MVQPLGNGRMAIVINGNNVVLRNGAHLGWWQRLWRSLTGQREERVIGAPEMVYLKSQLSDMDPAAAKKLVDLLTVFGCYDNIAAEEYASRIAQIAATITLTQEKTLAATTALDDVIEQLLLQIQEKKNAQTKVLAETAATVNGLTGEQELLKGAMDFFA